MLNMTKERSINQKIQTRFARVDSQANPKMTIVWEFCPGSLPSIQTRCLPGWTYGNFYMCICWFYLVYNYIEKQMFRRQWLPNAYRNLTDKEAVSSLCMMCGPEVCIWLGHWRMLTDVEAVGVGLTLLVDLVRFPKTLVQVGWGTCSKWVGEPD